MQFRFFLRPRYRIGIFFWVSKIPNIFLGHLNFLIFLDAGSEPTYGEKIRVPPPPPGHRTFLNSFVYHRSFIFIV